MHLTNPEHTLSYLREIKKKISIIKIITKPVKSWTETITVNKKKRDTSNQK